MTTLRRNGESIFFEDTGSGDPPIVLVHGVGAHEHFAAQIEHFSRRHRVVAPDLPGFGRSDAPERDYSVEAFADDVGWLCDRLDVRGAVVVGHSMGGAVAFQLAARRPDLAAAVVMLDPIPVVPSPVFVERMGALVTALRGPGYRAVLRGFAEAQMFRPGDDPAVRARIVDDMTGVPQHVVAPMMASALSWRGEDVAPLVNVPVLMITAGDGIPADMARIREVVPRLELGRTVGVGHFAHLLAAQQVNAMIDRFLEVSVLAPSPA